MGSAAENIFDSPFSVKERNAAAPPDDRPMTQWATEEFHLDETSKVKGFYPIDLVPTARFFFEKCEDKKIRRIWNASGAQQSKTSKFSAAALCFTMEKGLPVMINLASEDTANYVGKKRIKYAIEKNPRLKKMTKKGSYTDTEMTFINGGYLVMGWGGSVERTATRTIGKMFNDEIDKPNYKRTSSESGSLERLTERGDTYDDFLEVNVGTPTDEKANLYSGIKSSQLIYDFHVPCPYCGLPQPLIFRADYAWGFKDGMFRDYEGKMRKLGQVYWEGGSKATTDQIKKTARYQCGECRELWTNAQKNRALDKLIPVSRTEPTGDEWDISILEWRIYTKLPGGRLVKIITKYLEAVNQKDKEKRKSKLQNFINSSLGQPWEQVVISKTLKQVFSAACAVPFQTVPQGASALNLYMDNQITGKWYGVQAWDNLFNSWLLEYNYFGGFESLTKFILNTTFPVENSNRRMGFWRIGIDTGGGKKFVDASMVEECYLWILEMRKHGVEVHATKGASSPIPGGYLKVGAPLQKTPSNRSISGGLPIVSLDTNQLKDMYHGRLNNAIKAEPAPRGAYLYKGIGNTEMGKTFAAQVTAEVKKEDNKGIRTWIDESGGNNHALDVMVGHEAMASPFWPGGGVNLLTVPQYEIDEKDIKQKPNKKQKRSSRW